MLTTMDDSSDVHFGTCIPRSVKEHSLKHTNGKTLSAPETLQLLEDLQIDIFGFRGDGEYLSGLSSLRVKSEKFKRDVICVLVDR